MTTALTLLDTPERLACALPDLRRRILDRLREPASAAELAREFDLPRQNLNYHLRVLEGQQLLELVELRARRGFTERVMRTVGNGLVVDPDVLARTPPAPDGEQDRHAAQHLVQAAGAVVRDVSRMSGRAERQGRRLLTFTLEADVRFSGPGDVHDFTDALAQAVAQVVAAYDTPGGRPYRLLTAGHPAAVANTESEEETDVRTRQ
ncbi:MAG TPA: helix-turn-helix domain-containing protein [Nakamurella sp.]